MGNSENPTKQGTRKPAKSGIEKGISVTVRAFGEISECIGNKHLVVQLESGSNIADLLRALFESSKEQISLKGEFNLTDSGIYLVILDGETLTMPQDLELELRDGADFLLIPVIEGG